MGIHLYIYCGSKFSLNLIEMLLNSCSVWLNSLLCWKTLLLLLLEIYLINQTNWVVLDMWLFFFMLWFFMYFLWLLWMEFRILTFIFFFLIFTVRCFSTLFVFLFLGNVIIRNRQNILILLEWLFRQSFDIKDFCALFLQRFQI